MATNKFRNIQYYYQQKYRISICNQVLSIKNTLLLCERRDIVFVEEGFQVSVQCALGWLDSSRLVASTSRGRYDGQCSLS